MDAEVSQVALACSDWHLELRIYVFHASMIGAAGIFVFPRMIRGFKRYFEAEYAPASHNAMPGEPAAGR